MKDYASKKYLEGQTVEKATAAMQGDRRTYLLKVVRPRTVAQMVAAVSSLEQIDRELAQYTITVH